MRERVDRAEVLGAVDLVDLVSRYVTLKKAGKEYEACCPFHQERTPSFRVVPQKQFYYCFGCGAKGDAIRFLTDYEDISFIEAVKRLNAGALPERTPDRPAPPPLTEQDEAPTWLPITPVPESATPLMNGDWTVDIYNPKRAGEDKEWTRFRPQMVHPYCNADGDLLGYVLRMEWAKKGDDGQPALDEHGQPRMQKITPQITWCMNSETGQESWAMVNFGEPRPLYGLETLAAMPKGPVIIPEGEKCQEAARRLLPKLPAVSWPGGGKALGKVDFSPLAGRNVILWPDADMAGHITTYGMADDDGELAMKGLVQYLAEAGVAAIKVVEPPANVADGWDIWDAEAEGWTSVEVAAYIKTHVHDPLPPYSPNQAEPEDDDGSGGDELYQTEALAHSVDADEQPSFAGDEEEEDAPAAPLPAGPGILRPDDPVRALGYDHGVYYYLAKGARQVIELSAGSHSKLGLMSMADLDFWTNRYPKDSDNGGVAWDMAVNALMRACEDQGVFDPERLRGRGAWWDEGRSVLHLGDHLAVEGKRVELAEKAGWYIYEAAAPMRVDIDNPLTPREAIQLLEICKNLQWEKPMDAYLLAGWIFIAPVCGALDWRPHVWITGGAGSGKTWCVNNVVGKATGRFALKPLSSTTEAAIRQRLGHDARPVIFDEAEGEDQQAQQRLQNVMQLVRQASSEGDGEIMKGSAGGKAMSFRARSMFAFASIGVAAHQYADKTRITVLQLRPDASKTPEEREQQFRELEKLTYTTLTDEFIEQLNARAVRMIPVIRANAKTFARAGARVIGQQRLGDQIGALLAGAHALHSNKVISLEEAQAWIQKQDWSEEFMLSEQRDESSCLSRIMEHVVRASTTLGNTVDRSIGELVRIAIMGNPQSATEQVDPAAASDTLLRYGIKARMGEWSVTISNTHTGLARILRDSPWPTNWGRILKRLPGAEATEKPEHFSGGSSRGVIVPMDAVFGH